MKLIFKFKGCLKKRVKTFDTEEAMNEFIASLEEKNLVDFGNEVLNVNNIVKLTKRF